MYECRHCGETVTGVVHITENFVHHGRILCNICGGFIQWAKKPQNENKRTKTSKYSVENIGKDCCELCRRTKDMLENNQTLEIHHKDCNAENDVIENLIAVCTHCHNKIHVDKRHLFDNHKGRV